MARVKRGLLYLRKHGLKAFCKKFYEKVRLYFGVSYRSWQRSHRLTRQQLNQQAQEGFAYMPKISVILPLCRAAGKNLQNSIKSVQEQTYGNWELILVAGSEEVNCAANGLGAKAVEGSKRLHVAESSKATDAAKGDNAWNADGHDHRIRYFCDRKQPSMTEKINSAVRTSSGEYIAFLEPEDLLTRDALYECVKALNENPETEFLYSDEDKVLGNRKNYVEPCFKPDFNPDLLRNLNYIGHLAAVRRSLWEKAGPLRSDYKRAEGYDFVLRCVEQTKAIYHIPKVLYHGRISESWAKIRFRRFADLEMHELPGNQKIFKTERRVLEEHLKRSGEDAHVVSGTILYTHHVVYSCKDEPLVSVIIPNKDAAADLQKCLDSLEQKSSYRNLEYIIVENNSEQDETFQYYEKLQRQNPRVKVHRYSGSFNYSKINNFGVEKAKGEYLLLLNNDTALKEPDSIREMLGICMRRDVGAVGAKLLYFDDTIQHAGVVIGAGGIAGHCFVGMQGCETGYCGRAACIQDYNAVTAACLMTKRSVFEALSGLREEFEVAFNDIDYCMRIRQQGSLVVYTPYAEFYHYESKTRGLDTEPEKKERFLREIRLFEQLWPEILEKGDCYYNPNLSYKKADFTLGL